MDHRQHTTILTVMDMQAVMDSLRAMARGSKSHACDPALPAPEAAYWQGYNHAVFEIANHVLLPADRGDLSRPLEALKTDEAHVC